MAAMAPRWMQRQGEQAGAAIGELRDDPDLRAVVQQGVDRANAAAVGYQAAVHGQAGRNGVAVLSRTAAHGCGLRVR